MEKKTLSPTKIRCTFSSKSQTTFIAEQFLREAPKQRVEDFEELHEYRGRKQKEFEERIRRTRGSIKEWLQYANWEPLLYFCVWTSRAVTLLPRADQLWYKYVYLEELLQNPDDKVWQAYIKMEERYGELDRASAIYERWIAVRPEPRVWVKWGKYEEERQKLDKAREVFQTALDFYNDDEEQVAKMETPLKEYDRAQQHGTRTGKRRIQYEEELDYDRARQIYQTAITLVPHKVFTFSKLWIMFAKLEIRHLDLPATRKILGNAIGMCPKEKLFKGYVELETDLREFDCVGGLCEGYLEVGLLSH
ncbi:hypothetical protein BDP27DRAFT_1382629 [Rhodocollybia butyracea]|uniref:Pre-mRNA-splicing factor Syf1-like N-terminal HAT-repeats domain-containing protein n=1 Tax=Rhodocollybia butyracea TaxID=206335 RepID=A0A9P5U9C5_9AGAR|nr:hypothetical protein BDP27DRAFT_1382629 [Rhodocollybia butyracea]